MQRLLHALARRRQDAREGGPRAHRIAARWRRKPGTLGARACLFVMLARDGRLLPHGVDHARAWHDAGYAVVAVIAAERAGDPVDVSPIDFAAGILQRDNRGYDFGAWAAAIRRLGRRLRTLDTLALANDSVLGPSASFPAMLRAAREVGADVAAPLESSEHLPHLQSFVMFFGRRALDHRVFRRFWRRVRTGERAFVIDRYELRLRWTFEAAGLTAAALFPQGNGVANPSLTDWRTLIAAGFPYLKIELLRDNPWHASLEEWRTAAAAAGFDVPRLDAQLAALEAIRPTRWAHHAAVDAPGGNTSSTV